MLEGTVDSVVELVTVVLSGSEIGFVLSVVESRGDFWVEDADFLEVDELLDVL